jgi:hypothetical protein
MKKKIEKKIATKCPLTKRREIASRNERKDILSKRELVLTYFAAITN